MSNSMFSLGALKEDDVLAMTETYRVYEILSDFDKKIVPNSFTDALLKYADLSKVPAYNNPSELNFDNISEKGKYLITFMCTFSNYSNLE